MRILDTLNFSQTTLRAYPARTALILLAMAIGVASVIILTSLGEGARNYVTGQFRSLGTHLLFILPGRSETTGGLPPLLGTSPRDLTIDDAIALKQSPAIRHVAPLLLGNAPVSHASREREVTVLGSSSEMQVIMTLEVIMGKFLPAENPRIGSPVCVLGDKLYHELFGNRNPIGEWVRIGSYRYRVIGVLGDKERAFGFDNSDAVIIPVASAQTMFNKTSLFRILVKASSADALDRAKEDVLRIIRQRHEGEDDVTVIRQDALIGTFDEILKILTWVVAGIAAISLIVAGILIMNVMLVSVSQRRAEIGLLKALGASTREVLQLFLSEALILSLAGGVIGLGIGFVGAQALQVWLPDFPVQVPLWSIIAALLVTLITGLAFGLIPARQAARLDPVIALAGK